MATIAFEQCTVGKTAAGGGPGRLPWRMGPCRVGPWRTPTYQDAS